LQAQIKGGEKMSFLPVADVIDQTFSYPGGIKLDTFVFESHFTFC